MDTEFLSLFVLYLVLKQGSANCGPQARFYFEWNAALESKICGPAPCKCGSPKKTFRKQLTIFSYKSLENVYSPLEKMYCLGLKM